MSILNEQSMGVFVHPHRNWFLFFARYPRSNTDIFYCQCSSILIYHSMSNIGLFRMTLCIYPRMTGGLIMHRAINVYSTSQRDNDSLMADAFYFVYACVRCVVLHAVWCRISALQNSGCRMQRHAAKYRRKKRNALKCLAARKTQQRQPIKPITRSNL